MKGFRLYDRRVDRGLRPVCAAARIALRRQDFGDSSRSPMVSFLTRRGDAGGVEPLRNGVYAQILVVAQAEYPANNGGLFLPYLSATVFAAYVTVSGDRRHIAALTGAVITAQLRTTGNNFTLVLGECGELVEHQPALRGAVEGLRYEFRRGTSLQALAG